MSNGLLDEELLTQYINNIGADVLVQVVDLYDEKSKGYLDDINNAIDEQSIFLWKEHCHKMKGAASTVGLKVLHAYIETIEQAEVLNEEKSLMLVKLTELNKLGIAALNFWLKRHGFVTGKDHSTEPTKR